VDALNKEDKYLKWLAIAEYDLDTAKVMLDSNRYIYVAFMCQQALEKLAKGVFVYHFDKEAKYTHNINLILEKIDNLAATDDYKNHETLFSELTSYYIVGRYDAYKQNISNELNQAKAKDLFDKSKEAFAWLKSQTKL
jgi:HEPN domain-containing protein